MLVQNLSKFTKNKNITVIFQLTGYLKKENDAIEAAQSEKIKTGSTNGIRSVSNDTKYHSECPTT